MNITTIEEILKTLEILRKVLCLYIYVQCMRKILILFIKNDSLNYVTLENKIKDFNFMKNKIGDFI